MSTWTFTTTNLKEAAAISLLCVTQGLHGVTETKQDTPNELAQVQTRRKSAQVQTRRKSAPTDHGCWRDPEARKVRAKVNARVAARMKNLGQVIATRDRIDSPEEAYAAAMGWTKEKAQAKIKAHEAHLDANPPEYRW